MENPIIVYTVPEVAKLLRIRPGKAYELVKSGLLPSIKLGDLKVTRQSIEKFLNDYQGYDLEDCTNPKKIEY